MTEQTMEEKYCDGCQNWNGREDNTCGSFTNFNGKCDFYKPVEE